MNQFHPLADIFPLMEGRDFDELCDSIKSHGQLEPIWLVAAEPPAIDDLILDGRNRYRACQRLGIAPAFEWYTGNDPLSFVVNLNLHRRHLNEAQRSAVAASISNMVVGGKETNSANWQNWSSGQSVSRSRAAEMLNVSERSVNRAVVVKNDGTQELFKALQSGRVSTSAAADVATLPKPQQVEIVARGERQILEAAKEIRAGRAQERRIERIEKIVSIAKGNTDLSTAKKYPVIYCDPPWRYDYAPTESRAIENQYPTMDLEEICALPVGDIAHTDAVLFMWATSPKLADAMAVIESWGFTYKTCAIWDKQKIGMGYYFRQRHELLLVATKGAPPAPSPADRPDSVFSFARSEHSAKPIEVARMIEQMYPLFDRVELFCRDPQAGWSVWGNQSNAA